MSELRSGRSGRYVLLLKGFILVMLLLQVGLLFRSDRAFLSRPYFEDTFYAMTVARWLAEGQGFTVDGVHPTSGVQPLICLLYAPSFMLSGGDLYLGLRFTMLLQIVLYTLVAWLATRFLVSMFRGGADRQVLFWLAFALIFVNYALSVQFLNGLETSLVVGLTFLSLLQFNRLEERKEGGLAGYLGLGALLGLTILARVDAIILLIALVLWKLYIGHKQYGDLKPKERLQGGLRTLGALFMMGTGALIVSGPWWLYNVIMFGNPVPVSGLSQQGLNPDQFLQVIETINVALEAIIPGVVTPSPWRLLGIAWVGLVLLLLISAILLFSESAQSVARLTYTKVKHDWNLRKLAPLAITMLGLALFYTFFFRAPHFQARYLILMTLTILLVVVMVVVSANRVPSMSTLFKKGSRLVVVLILSFSLFFFLRHYVNAYGNMMMLTVDWIDENAGQDERIGIFQSGTVGFLYPEKVVNLDGKVNPEAFHAYKNQRLPRYVDSMDFDYIIDWKFYTDRIFYDSTLSTQYRLVDTLTNHMGIWKKIDGRGGE